MMTAELTAPAVSPSKVKRTAWLGTTLCLVLSLVFLTSALAKIRSFSELESTLAASKLVPVLMVSQAATLLLVTELLLASLLILPPTRRAALHASAVVVSAFAAYSTWRWMQGIAVPCHCFGALLKIDPWAALLLNCALLGIIAHLLFTSKLSLPRKSSARQGV